MMPRRFNFAASLLLAGLLFAACSTVVAQTPYDDAFKAGQELEKAGKLAEARAEYDKALAVTGLTPEQFAKVMLQVASNYMKEYKWSLANTNLEKVIAMAGVPSASKAQAYLLVAQIFANYGGEWGWGRVKVACTSALAIPDLAAEQKIAVQQFLIKALVGLRDYPAARRVMVELVAAGNLPPKERAAMQIVIAKLCLAERNFEEARTESAKALAMEGLSEGDKADLQLNLALSYYYAKDYEHAKPELLKVLAMPGANWRCNYPTRNSGYTPATEANLKLRFQKMAPAAESAMAVLFIGSSMTTNGDMPNSCAAIAASAPAGQPRILPEIYGRNGTKIDVFWNDGDATAETARSVIASEPWDAVVVETFYTMSHDDLVKYVTLFNDLIRSRGAKMVLYASPADTSRPYPADHRAFRDEINALGRTLGVPVAPAAGAYMYLLGEAPKQEQFYELYAGSIHPTAKGSYVIACCYYAALTGRSPVGLAHPGISDEDAKRYQEAAWKAFQDSQTAGQPNP